MFFKNRKDAGEKLAERLTQYAHKIDTLVVGLPRGGVVIAAIIAHKLKLPLAIICPKKIGAPYNPELAIGAVTETGEVIYNLSLIATLGVDEKYLHSETRNAQKKAQSLSALYRKSQALPDFKNKTVIVCDDGLATGATMTVAIKALRAQEAHKIVVAIPVGPPDTVTKITAQVDQLICLEIPDYFLSVGNFYEDFAQVTDQEVIELL